MNEWTAGWAIVSIALLVRAAVSKDPWWARLLAVVFAILPLVAQSLALMLRETYGELQTRRWFLLLWEQAPWSGSLFLLGWSVVSRDPRSAKIVSAVIALIGLFPIVFLLLLVFLALLGVPIGMH
jgi:hypothetical protein